MFGLDGLIGGWFGYQGQREANETNIDLANINNQFNADQAELQRTWSAEQASKAMDFSKSMSNTQWQRGVKDMQRAGLNPMLAYSQGGASSPGGATGSGAAATGHPARVENTNTAALSSALSAATAAAQIEKIDAETEHTKAATRTEEKRPAHVTAETEQAQARAIDIKERLRVLMPEEHAKLVSEVWLNNRRDQLTEQQWRHEFEKTKLTKAEITQALLAIPKMSNEAAMESTAFKKYISPFLPDVLRGGSSAGQINRLFRR